MTAVLSTHRRASDRLRVGGPSEKQVWSGRKEGTSEVRAYLPDAERKDVKVTNDGDQTLRVSVSHRKQQKRQDESGQAIFSELGQYEQLVTLPEPANTNDMKVDTRENEVVITIPKKKTS